MVNDGFVRTDEVEEKHPVIEPTWLRLVCSPWSQGQEGGTVKVCVRSVITRNCYDAITSDLTLLFFLMNDNFTPMDESLVKSIEAFPPAEARPEQIRPYLAHVLLTHGMIEEQAVQVASHWNIGSGQDLRSCPLELLRATFGDLAGWVLYNNIRARTKKEQAQAGWSSQAKCELQRSIRMSLWPLQNPSAHRVGDRSSRCRHHDLRVDCL